MKKVILHIGAPKTGSSSIQAFLCRNAEKLEGMGYIVPLNGIDFGELTGEQVFAIESLASVEDHRLFWNKVGALFEGRSGHTLILSAENLANEGREVIAETAPDAFDLQIILYVRRQDDYLSAAWQQWYSKVEDDLNAWLILALREMGHWDTTLSDWERVVGRDALTVRVFEPDSLLRGDVVADFIDAIGLDPGDFLPAGPRRVDNPSINELVTSLLEGNRAVFANSDDNRIYDVLLDVTGDALLTRPKISLLSPGQREKIQEYYRLGNEAVCRTYFPDRGRLFAEVDHARYRYVGRMEAQDEKLKAVMTILSRLMIDLRQRNVI